MFENSIEYIDGPATVFERPYPVLKALYPTRKPPSVPKRLIRVVR